MNVPGAAIRVLLILVDRLCFDRYKIDYSRFTIERFCTAYRINVGPFVRNALIGSDSFESNPVASGDIASLEAHAFFTHLREHQSGGGTAE